MIPLSVLPIFKWLILPLWQRLAGPVWRSLLRPFSASSGPSSGQQSSVVTGHAIPDRNRFYKACSHNKMTHLEPLEIDQYPILRGIEGGRIICNRLILFNSQQIILRKLLNNYISFRWQLCGAMRSHTTSINACM